MTTYPQLPIQQEAIVILIEQWVEKFPIIEMVSICRGRKPYVLLFKLDGSFGQKDVNNFREWIDFQNLNALRDIEKEYSFCGLNFQIDEWECWIEDGTPNPFFYPNTRKELYPFCSYSHDNYNKMPKNGLRLSEGQHGQEGSKISNIFQKTGPTWKIIYNGKELNGLRGKGFDYIHFLVTEKEREFSPLDLITAIDKENTTAPGWGSAKASLDYDEGIGGEGTSRFENSKEMTKGLRSEYQKKMIELKEAEIKGDRYIVDELERELRLFTEQITSMENPMVNHATRAGGSVAQAIRRALKRLESEDQATYLHFKQSLGSIKSNTHSYQPDREINWLT